MKKIFKEDLEESIIELFQMWYNAFESNERIRIANNKEPDTKVQMEISENMVIAFLNDNVSHFLNFLNFANNYIYSQTMNTIYNLVIEKIYGIFDNKKPGRPKDSIMWIRKNIPNPTSIEIRYYSGILITWENWVLEINSQMKNDIV